MPHIGITSGHLSEEKKRRIIERLTAEASAIMEIPAEFFTVTITEVPDVNYGIGGDTIDRIKEQYKQTEGK